MALMGGYVGINSAGGSMNMQLYFHKAVETLYFSDFFPAVIKTIFFGMAIGFVGCYKGYHSNKGTESVGLAANSAVVAASIWIIILDAIAVQITSVFVYN
jgi:phospholipid/cholesterol/gamma-HCH transport system permease protein